MAEREAWQLEEERRMEWIRWEEEEELQLIKEMERWEKEEQRKREEEAQRKVEESRRRGGGETERQVREERAVRRIAEEKGKRVHQEKI